MGDYFKKRQAKALKELEASKEGKTLKTISKIVNFKNFNQKYNFVISTDDQDLWNTFMRYFNSTEHKRKSISVRYKGKLITCILIENYEFFLWLKKNKAKYSDYEIYYEIKRKGENNNTGPWTKLNLDFWK